MIRAYSPADLPQGSAAWLRVRSRRVGASEIAAIGGRSPHTTPSEVWARKTGRPYPRHPRGLHLDIGHALEPLALREWARETGRSFERGPTLVEIDGFRAASLDAWATCEPVDAKVTLPHTDRWDGVPLHIVLQLLQQADLAEALTGSRLEAAHVAQLDLGACRVNAWRLPLDAEHRDMMAEWRGFPARWWSAYVAGDAIPDDATCAQVFWRRVDREELPVRPATAEEANLLAAFVAAEEARAALDRPAREARDTRDALRDDLARRLGGTHLLPGLRLVRRSGGRYLAPSKDNDNE